MTDLENNKKVFDRNIERVRSLCRLYNSLKSDDIKEGKEYKHTDILRSATVMLHSSFEEYYRNTLGDVLPAICTEEDLKNVSFFGSNGNHREKITLGALVALRGKTVDEVITESIQETLSYTSFNNYQDIATWARKIKVDLSEFEKQEKLNNLILRRHKIVHEADNANDGDKYSLTGIRENLVSEWISVVCDLVEIIERGLHTEN